MKVTVLTYSFPAVSETFIARHARYLDADVVCHEKSDSLPPDYYGSFRICSLQNETQSAVVSAIQRQWKKIRWHKNKYLAPRHNYIWGHEMNSSWGAYLDKKLPDIVLAEFAPNAMSALPECLRRGIPVVPHFHGFDASTLMRNPAYRRDLQALFAGCPAIVCVSHFQERVLQQTGCPASKLHVIPCGAPVEEFRPSDEIRNQPCRFVAVSRLVAGKGPMVVMNAFHEVNRQRPGVRLTYVGDGPLRRELTRFVEVNGLRPSVEFLGSIPNARVRQLFRESSVFLQASLTDTSGWVEGWGVSLAEALASGLPAVVTRSGGMVDLVSDGYNGFLFEEGDWEQMAAKMQLLADDPNLRSEMGKRGREHVEKFGSTDVNLKRLRTLLFAVCSKSKSD